MSKTGLFFGSFNPVHVGHLALANYILAYGQLDEVWFILSPSNPLKNQEELAGETERAAMVKIALKGEPRFKYCDIELSLPKPSYTINTLEKLRQLYPRQNFSIIMGSDNYLDIDKWKEHGKLLATGEIIVYPRPGYPVGITNFNSLVKVINAPLFEISATMIREAIRDKRHIPFLLPAGVFEYIKQNNLYSGA